MTQTRLAEILLIEDNPGDVVLMKEALKQANFSHHLSVVNDGVEAMNFLYRKDNHSDAPRPDLILLDLKMPKKDGSEVLAEIKSDNDLKRIPVVVLSSSKSEQDIFNVYNLHGNAYMTKSVLFKQLLDKVQALKNFWFVAAALPAK